MLDFVEDSAKRYIGGSGGMRDDPVAEQECP